MPAFDNFEEDEVSALIAYLHSISKGSSKNATVPGDSQRGEELYAKNGCVGCHRVGMKGSVYGPDLSRIGAARSLTYLRDSIVHPSADVPVEYEGVSVTLKNGSRIRGIRINEDTFTVQLRTPDQRFASFIKDDLQAVENVKGSLMPAYDKLPEADLRDLIAYLASLRGDASESGSVKGAGGIK